jgi:hypothetical protein
VSSYNPIVIPDPDQSLLVLTPFLSPQSDASAIIPILELTEALGGKAASLPTQPMDTI